jgi:hypothetical protein
MPRPISWLARLHEIRRAVASSVRYHFVRKGDGYGRNDPTRSITETAGYFRRSGHRGRDATMAVVASISSKSGRRLQEGFDFNLHSSIEKSAAVTRECPLGRPQKTKSHPTDGLIHVA